MDKKKRDVTRQNFPSSLSTTSQMHRNQKTAEMHSTAQKLKRTLKRRSVFCDQKNAQFPAGKISYPTRHDLVYGHAFVVWIF